MTDDDGVTDLRALADWFKRIPVGATTRIESDFTEDLAHMLKSAADEIERLRKELIRTQKIACDNFARRATVTASKRARWFAEQMKWDCFKEATR